MLGRLLHIGTGSPGQLYAPSSHPNPDPVSFLESVQEDAHTRNLLFPDAEALINSGSDQVFDLSTAPTAPFHSVFDFGDDVDLDVRDVRIILMQDTLGPNHASLLFDSHPLPAQPSSSTSADRSTGMPETTKTPSSSRKSSLTQPTRPVIMHAESPYGRTGAFDRRASVHGRVATQPESEAQRNAREYREELATFSSCIFGNSELMAYKGTSTKVHVVPSDLRSADSVAGLASGDLRSSVGRSAVRNSNLSQSYSSQTMSPTTGLPIGSTQNRSDEKRKVLITRLFPVNLPNEDSETSTTPQSRMSDDNAAFPFPSPIDDSTPRKKKPQPRQRRTPMYAVVLVVTLPSPVSRNSSAGPARSGFRGESGSYNEQDFLASSYNSTRLGGWNMNGQGQFGSTLDSAFPLDLEDRMDPLTQHWDVIIRTLTHLQSVAASRLLTFLKQADVSSPGPQPFSSGHLHNARSASISERRLTEISRAKPPKSTTKLVSLNARCLASDERIATQVDDARSRIVRGVSAARAVTGQGRWGIWRDEAIWISKWASSANQQNSFLSKLLAAFLATHTEWIQALCPATYRRRVVNKQHKLTEEDLSLPARTVIVSDNKMAARRLIFLLSAFLPANQQTPTIQTHRPSTSTSIGPFSNSPPTYIIPVLREESLRRRVNRRSGLGRHSRTTSQAVRGSTIPAQLEHLSMEVRHERRVSDAGSILASNFSAAGNDLLSRKSSTATTTTIMPEPTIPHFSSVRRGENHRRSRPDSTDSVVVDDLKRSLRRGESSGHVSSTSTDSRSQSSKWGSIMSGLWSPRRRGSTDKSSFSQGSDAMSPARATFPRPDKLSQMVHEEALSTEDDVAPDAQPPPRIAGARSFGTPQKPFVKYRNSFAQEDRTPDPNGAFESPVKTSINADDGVIDVDVSFPDYIASFESAISSPSSSGYLSTPGLPGGFDTFEQASRILIDGDMPLNAAGWLNGYHPDFALQANPPQDDLIEKLKASLRAEPTPIVPHAPGFDMMETWVDVASAVIADTRSQSIVRLTYRRLVKPRLVAEQAAVFAVGATNTPTNTLLTPSLPPCDHLIDEEWIEENIVSPDSNLASALDKILESNPPTEPTRDVATPQFPASQGSQGSSSTLQAPSTQATEVERPNSDIPRMQCKSIILSALEEMVQDVIQRYERNTKRKAVLMASAGDRNLLRNAIRNWVALLDAEET